MFEWATTIVCCDPWAVHHPSTPVLNRKPRDTFLKQSMRLIYETRWSQVMQNLCSSGFPWFIFFEVYSKTGNRVFVYKEDKKSCWSPESSLLLSQKKL